MADTKHTTASAVTEGMSRRRFLRAAPVAGAAVAIPALSKAGAPETPVTRAYREWKAYRDWLHNGTSEMPDDEFDALCGKRQAMEIAMFGLPNVDLRDAVLKLMAWTDCGEELADDDRCTGAGLLKEMGALAGALA